MRAIAASAVAVLLVLTVGAERTQSQSEPLRIELIDFGRQFDASVALSSAAAVNDRGVVVGTVDRVDGSRAVFTWTRANGARIRIEDASASDINNRGEIVGRRFCGGGCWPPAGFRWSGSTGLRDLGQFLPNAINESGDMAGECSGRACASIARRLRMIAPLVSVANGINEDGAVAGSWYDEAAARNRPFTWSLATGRRLLDDSGADGGGAIAINDFGQVVGVLFRPFGDGHATVATRWRRIGRITAVHPNHSTQANAVNNIGRVAGHASALDPGDESSPYPILWRLGRVIKLPLGRYSAGVALDINSSNQIAGYLWGEGVRGTAVMWRVIE
jgi:uncharacterized membrane protein